MITLYGSATSPNVLKVRLLLEEAGIPYQDVRVKREEGENLTPEFLKISASGTLPAIVDDETGAHVFESSAILLYLADRYREFLPQEEPARADVFKWLIYEAANVSPAVENIYKLHYLADDWVESALEFQRQKLISAIRVLDGSLIGQEYIAGNCSIADFALFPLTNLFEDFLEKPLSDFPNLSRWCETMQSRAAVQRVNKTA